jgi:glucokinase
MNCLIADIGATHARFAITASERKIEFLHVYQSSEFGSLQNAVNHYLKEPALRNLPRPAKAALAVAAPLSGDQVELPNRAWSFSRMQLQAELGFPIEFYNDFTAVAMAVPHLHAGDILPIGVPVPQAHGAIAVIGPGTGLGVAGLVRVQDRWTALPAEGGHATMAAATREESEVLNILRVRWGHVSAERVLSGPGLTNIYEALGIAHSVETPKLRASEITAEISKLEGEHGNPLCVKAFDLFCAMLGTMAGNVALTLGATGGVYIAGGILPRVQEAFAASRFRARFEQKGRLSDYMKSIPTYLILHEAPALLGLIHVQTPLEAKRAMAAPYKDERSVKRD